MGILLPSAFWCVRDWQATGNPLYPTPISLGRHLIFAGYSLSGWTTASVAGTQVFHPLSLERFGAFGK